MKLGVGQRRVARWVAWGAILFVVVGVMAGCGGASGQNTGTNKQTPSGGGSSTATTGGATGGVGGAHITKPFDRAITGSQCYAGTGANKGKAAFGFPTRDLTSAALSFSLGPLTDGTSPGQEHNAPYTGAGSYDNIGIVVRPESGSPIIGYGVVTVNSDKQTGSFRLSGGAEGTWDCGRPVMP
jgi:hypothetical protein